MVRRAGDEEFRFSPVATLRFGAGDDATDANDAYRKLVGLSASAPLGGGFWDHLEAGAEEFRTSFANGTGAPNGFAVVIVDGHGARRPMRVFSATLPNGQDRVVTLVDLGVPATEDERLITEGIRFRTIVSQLQDGVWALDKDARTTFVNPRMAQMLATSVTEMVGSSMFDWIAEADRPAAARNFEERSAGASNIHEFTFRRADGTSVETLVSANPMLDNGVVVGAAAVVTDISVIKHTQELLSAALREARDANESMKRLLSHVSHEIRTPLQAVVGYASLLARHQDPQVAAHAKQIERGGQHLAGLTEDLLELSRATSGRMDLDIRTVGVQEALSDAMVLAASPPGLLRHEVGTLSVLADRSRLAQVLVNLITNARLHGPPDEAITVSAAARRGFVDIFVRDEGCGIRPADAARVFEPFVQLGESARGGSGLGLAVCKGLVEAMGGEISLHSTQPTCFRVSLPAGSAAAAEPVRLPVVVVIEDDDLCRTLLETVLTESSDLAVESAANLAEGMRLVSELSPAVVLLDVNLPDGSGLDALRWLRSDPRTAGLRVIVLTADSTPAVRAVALAAGANGFMTKPFRIDDLLADVHRYAGEQST